MSKSDDTTKMIVNGAYHALTISALMAVNCWSAKKFFKFKSANLGQLDVEDIGKLTLSVGVATYTRDLLVKQGLIPEDIITGQIVK